MKHAALLLSLCAACGRHEPHEHAKAPAPEAAAPVEPPRPLVRLRADAWKDVTLARSTAPASPIPAGLRTIVVTPKEIRVDGEAVLALPLAPSDVASFGGLKSLPALVARLGDAGVGDAGEVAIAADARTTYGLLAEVLAASGLAGARTARVLVRAGDGDDVGSLGAPAPGPRAKNVELTIGVEEAGFYVTALQGPLDPTCTEFEKERPSTPTVDGTDPTSLVRCVRSLKKSVLLYSKADEAGIRASASLELQRVVDVIDALRPELPYVTFGLPR